MTTLGHRHDVPLDCGGMTDPWTGVERSTTTLVGVLTVASTLFFAVPTITMVCSRVFDLDKALVSNMLLVWFFVGVPSIVFLWGYLLAVMITRFYAGAGIIRRKDHCMRCGYALEGCPEHQGSITCPECGAHWEV